MSRRLVFGLPSTQADQPSPLEAGLAGGMSNVVVCFRQVRRTAQAVREICSWQRKDEQLTKALCKGLLPQVESADDEIRLQVKLAILEFQRISDLELNIDATLDAVACDVEKDRHDSLENVLCAHYDAEQMTDLVDWLVRLIGSRASLATASQNGKHNGVRKSNKRAHHLAFESAAVLLSRIGQLSRQSYPHLSASHFNVVALDAYIKANKDDEQLILSCSRFSSLLSLSTKVEILSSDFARRQRTYEREGLLTSIFQGEDYQRAAIEESRSARRLNVDRDNVLEDSRALLGADCEDLPNGIHVIFTGEEGEDAGGLLKEWMLLLCGELIPLVYHQVEKDGAKYEVRPDCSASDAQLMGILIGLSIRNRIPIDISIPNYIHRYLFSSSSNVPIATLRDLGQVQPLLAKGLAEMLLWGPEGFSERLSLTFSYHARQEDASIPLLPNGDQVAVTYANREGYVQRLCDYILHEQVEVQLQAMHYGLEQICRDLSSLHLFSIEELDGLVCGQEIALDVACLRRLSSTQTASQRDWAYIDEFWNVLEQANDPGMLRRLLHFVTANHRIAQGASPQETAVLFHIVVLHGKEFIDRLPTASTCTNTLFLPRYPTIDFLRLRLFTALDQGSIGFGLK